MKKISHIFKGIHLPPETNIGDDVWETYELDRRLVKESIKEPDFFDFYNRLSFLSENINKYHSLKKKEIKILDVGCAQAVYALYLSKNWNVVGIDLRKKFLKYANLKKKASNDLNLDFVLSDAHLLPFKKNSFDIVICTELVEHVLDITKLLKEINRVLCVEGICIISTPNGENILQRKPDFQYISGLSLEERREILNTEIEHVFLFTKHQIIGIMENSGFRILKFRLSDSLIMGIGTRFGVIWLPKILSFLPDRYFMFFVDELLCNSTFGKWTSISILVCAEVKK